MKNRINKFIVVCVLLTLTSCKTEKKLDEIYNEAGYAIGKIISSLSGTFAIQYNYSYFVGSSEYKDNKKEGGLNPSGTYMMGKRFLVVYKLSEPKKSDINFKYSIETEQDFLDMLVLFQNNPPKH